MITKVHSQMTLEARVVLLLAQLEARDARLDDPHGDGSGRGAQCPTGDDYNDVMQLVWGLLS